MTQKPLDAIETQFSKATDPCINRTKEHKLIEIIAIAICAILYGAEGSTDAEVFRNSKEHWLRSLLKLPHRISSHDTFRRIFSRIDAQQFQLAFYE